MEKKEETRPVGKKGFLGRILEKLDKKLEARAKETGCCAPKKDSGRKSCC